jgi:hypothetical protein
MEKVLWFQKKERKIKQHNIIKNFKIKIAKVLIKITYHPGFIPGFK